MPPAGAARWSTGAHRADGGRSGHHGARQHAQPDRQGCRAGAADHQMGHHRGRSAARRAPRWRACSPAAMRRAAAPPPSAPPATGRRRRARSPAASTSPPTRSAAGWPRPRATPGSARRRSRSSRKSIWPTASSSSSVHSPLIARAARAGQFVRVLAEPKGELIPLTLADWDVAAGTIDLVVQGARQQQPWLINRMPEGEAFAGIAGPLGQPSALHRYDGGQTVVFTAGGVGLPPVYPDRARAPAAGQPRDADRRVPQRRSGVLDRARRAGRAAAGGVPRPAGRGVHQQRRQLRHQGLRDALRWRRC